MTSRSRALSRSRPGSVAGSSAGTGAAGPAAANASSTKPASRGLKTTSPSATRRTAASRSGPEIVLVTYPRAPARMTAMTSSAASDTDSASQRTDGSSALSASSTARPPPPGRCTSSRTTSGSVARMPDTAPATSAASPTNVTSPPSSARTPERTMAWSSTTNTRTCCRDSLIPMIRSRAALRSSLVPRCDAHATVRSCGLLAGQHELDLGALPRRRPDLRRPPEAGQPAADRVPQATAVPRDRGRVEAGPPVADEDRHLLRRDLGVEVGGAGPRVLGGVDQGLPGRGAQRGEGVVDRGVTDHDRVDGERVVGLHLGDHARDQPGPGAAGRDGGLVQPGAQLALLAAGQPADRLGVVGV